VSEHKTQCDRCFRMMRPDQLVTEDTFKICKDTKACDDWVDQVCEDNEPLKNNQVLRQKVADLEAQLADLQLAVTEANQELAEANARVGELEDELNQSGEVSVKRVNALIDIDEVISKHW
jgi:septal ring factor EnvC (AmiA/AmiB activator)